MIRTLISTTAISASLLAVSPVHALGIGHSFFMRGEIVRVDAGGAVVCLGKVDGAHEGQVLEVYRQGHRFRRLVGHVEVDQVFDGHFAHIHITDGEMKKGYWVELKRSHKSDANSAIDKPQ